MVTRFRRATSKASLIALTVSILVFTIAYAASGDLDSTFSGNGKQTTDFGGSWHDIMYDLELQSDGKTVAVGVHYDPSNHYGNTRDFALSRYTTSGTLDSTFSGNGKQLTNFGGGDGAWDVEVLSGGKILVSGDKCQGSSNCKLVLARYTSGGNLDATFNGTGYKVVSYGISSNGTYGGLAVQADGKIVVAGYMMKSTGGYEFAVYRFDSSGSLDGTFSGDGRLAFGFGAGRQDFPYDVAIHDDKILVAGATCADIFEACNFALARINSNGTLDGTFSGDGKQITNLGANDIAFALTVQSNGKIVVAGDRSPAPNSHKFALARYNTGGGLDSTFNGTGTALFSFGTYADALDVLVQGDGKIVVAGIGDAGKFAILRLTATGAPDSTFSGDGKKMISFSPAAAVPQAIVRQGDGKYVLGGHMYDGEYDFALTRILP